MNQKDFENAIKNNDLGLFRTSLRDINFDFLVEVKTFKFIFVRFVDAVVENVEFENVSFQDCDIQFGDFFGCTFVNCCFANCDLNNTDFTHCRFSNVTFKNCNMYGQKLSHSEFENCTFLHCITDENNLNFVRANGIKAEYDQFADAGSAKYMSVDDQSKKYFIKKEI
jgi:uncharacterized protein YjbI with pentapeptide repeats